MASSTALELDLEVCSRVFPLAGLNWHGGGCFTGPCLRLLMFHIGVFSEEY